METDYKKQYIVSVIVTECLINDNDQVLDNSVIEKNGEMLFLVDTEEDANEYMDILCDIADSLIEDNEQVQEKEEPDRD